MEKSSDYLRPVFEKVLQEVDSRDELYGLAWKDPIQVPIDFLHVKFQQKSRGITHILDNGQAGERKDLLDELVYDLLGYAAMIHARGGK